MGRPGGLRRGTIGRLMTREPLLADHPDDAETSLVRVAAVVPGTAEEVWWSVATGAGIAGWYVPARVEPRVGGAVVTEHGPFGHSRGVVTAYDPPHRFAWEEREWGTDVPPWRTEILVDEHAPASTDVDSSTDEDDPGPRSGDRCDEDPGARGERVPVSVCTVRLTSGVTEDGPTWSPAVAATEEGWAAGMRNLRLARTHFPGEPAGGFMVVRGVRASRSGAWATLLAAIGADGARPGDAVRDVAGAPPLAGVVEAVGPTSLLLRVSEPAPGLLELSAHDFADPSLLVHAHLFGPAGPALAEAARPRWDAWLHARFPGPRPG